MILPSSAIQYKSQITHENAAALASVKRLWSRMGLDFDAGWARIAPQVLRVMHRSQLSLAEAAAEFIPTVLDETGQNPNLAAEVVPEAFVGMNGDGRDLGNALAMSTIVSKAAVAEGMAPPAALAKGGRWLTMAASSALSDTGRAAESAATAASSATGFVRMLTPPSCGRCAILAGRWYRWNAGFDRHPRCDCRGIPASEAVAEDMTVDPYAYFESLNPAEQAKAFGKNEAEAIREGGDIFQVVNARRGMTPTGIWTSEGATRRGYFRWSSEAGGRGTRTRRLSVPEIIRRSGGDKATTRRLLRQYGYITEQGQIPTGAIAFGR